MKGGLFRNSFFQGTIKKCTDDRLPESLQTTTVKKEVVVKTGKIINRWKRAIVVGQYESVCSVVGVFSPKGDRDLQDYSPGINAIHNFGLHMPHIKYKYRSFIILINEES